uniref:Aldehyde dehydrogenase domain-containing protein n=1 Tax=Hucho hucho TaxID=62062 RepID=A0A4W5RGX7_9TELE
MASQSEVIDRLRATFRSGVTFPEQFRMNQLQNLLSLVEENEQLIQDALHKDLHKPKFESVLSEIQITLNDLYFAMENPRTWMQPEYNIGKNLATRMDDCFIRREPLGVVLIIGGNCAVLKPSEICQATEQLLAELFPKYLSQVVHTPICAFISPCFCYLLWIINGMQPNSAIFSLYTYHYCHLLFVFNDYCRTAMQYYVVEQRTPSHC